MTRDPLVSCFVRARGLMLLRRKVYAGVAAGALVAAGLAAATYSWAGSPPSFVQQVTGHGHGQTRAVTMPSATVAGNRLIVEVGVWNYSSATATAVTDNAGDVFTKVLSFAA